jgi:hypothetical protein
MKNLHLISTDKPSRYVTNYMEQSMQFHNIYITSDEETLSNNGDYYLGHPNYNTVHKWNMKGMHEGKQVWIKKIILTTDQDLIADGVQAIDDEFLEWFVKNPSCERVNLENHVLEVGYNLYKITLPQETTEILEEAKERAANYMSLKGALEPNQIKCYCGHTTMCDCGSLDEAKQEENEIIDISDHDGIGNAVDNLNNEPPQETLEQAAENHINNDLDLYESLVDGHISYNIGINLLNNLFINGAKWQQKRSYSEAIEFAKWIRNNPYVWNYSDKLNDTRTTEELFEQLKKK